MKQRTETWRNWILENGSYKLVSLFVTLILWVTILGRRDFVLTKDLDIEFLLPKDVQMESVRGEKRVSVKVSGPRTALKRFAQAPGSITVDLTRVDVTERNMRLTSEIQTKNIEVPFGVKVVSIAPNAVDVVLSPAPKNSHGGAESKPDFKPDSKADSNWSGKSAAKSVTKSSPQTSVRPKVMPKVIIDGRENSEQPKEKNER